MPPRKKVDNNQEVLDESSTALNNIEQKEVQGKEQKTFGYFTGADGNTYELLIPKLSIAKKVFSAEEIISDETLREELVKKAWKGRDGQLDESEFEKNGVFRIKY